jgi:hypothetical protein
VLIEDSLRAPALSQRFNDRIRNEFGHTLRFVVD